jgi:hypothetical protein
MFLILIKVQLKPLQADKKWRHVSYVTQGILQLYREKFMKQQEEGDAG